MPLPKIHLHQPAVMLNVLSLNSPLGGLMYFISYPNFSYID